MCKWVSNLSSSTSNLVTNFQNLELSGSLLRSVLVTNVSIPLLSSACLLLSFLDEFTLGGYCFFEPITPKKHVFCFVLVWCGMGFFTNWNKEAGCGLGSLLAGRGCLACSPAISSPLWIKPFVH